MGNNTFYNYIYLDPRKTGDYNYGQYHFDYEPFYVGKGSNGRYKGSHYNCKEIFLELKSANIEHICIFPFENISETMALEKETEFICLIGRKDKGKGPLLNKKDRDSGNAGIIFSEDHKRKISEANKGEKNYVYGKHLSEEHKRKISKSLIGRKFSEERKQNMRGRIFSENSIQKIKEKRSKQIFSEETRIKMSMSQKRRFNGVI